MVEFKGPQVLLILIHKFGVHRLVCGSTALLTADFQTLDERTSASYF